MRKYIADAPVWLIVCLILMNNLWSFSGIDLKIYQILHLFVLVYMIFYIVRNMNNIYIPNSFHKWWVLLLIATPLLSVYSSSVLLGRAYMDSLVVYRMHLGLLLYFVMWYKGVSEKQLIGVLLVLGCGYALLTIFQQVTFPLAPFGMRSEASDYVQSHVDGVERRLGFYRFEITGVLYAVIIATLIFTKKIKLHKWLIIVIVLSLIASGNRRIIGITSVALGICYLLRGKSIRVIWYFFTALALFGVVYTYRFEIFGDLANWTEDLEEGRGHSYFYYLYYAFSKPLSIFMGWGVQRDGDGTPDYLYNYYVDGKPVVLADIGLVACLFYWGILYVISLVGLLLSLSFNKNLDSCYKGLAIGLLSFCWIYFFTWEIAGSSFLAVFVYACDLNIYNNKIKERILLLQN